MLRRRLQPWNLASGAAWACRRVMRAVEGALYSAMYGTDGDERPAHVRTTCIDFRNDAVVVYCSAFLPLGGGGCCCWTLPSCMRRAASVMTVAVATRTARALDVLHGLLVVRRLGGGNVMLASPSSPPNDSAVEGRGGDIIDAAEDAEDEGLLVAHEFVYKRRKRVALTRRVPSKVPVSAASRAVEEAVRRSDHHIVLLGDERTAPWFRCIDLSGVAETFLPSFALLDSDGATLRAADLVLARTLLPAWGREEAAAERAAKRACAMMMLRKPPSEVAGEVTRLDTFEDVRFDVGRDKIPVAIR